MAARRQVSIFSIASVYAVFYTGLVMAERVGFEPTLPFRVNTLSKRAPSATRPSLPFLRSECLRIIVHTLARKSVALATQAQRIAATGSLRPSGFCGRSTKTHAEIETLVLARLNLQGTLD